MPLAPGSRIGPYEILELLGAGGMGQVFRARDTRIGRNVALKLISENGAADARFRERFEREARLAGALAHPNVVTLFDVGFEGEQPFLVTELLEGETLRKRLSRGQLGVFEALEIGARIAQGLAAAHARGIAHRDLKPENVFLTRDGQVKVLDFGIAKRSAANESGGHSLLSETAPSSDSVTGTGTILGTPGYMSPEQIRGEAVDARTDVFSLGAVLYEMLGGRRAFPAGSVAEAGYAVLREEPEHLPTTVPALVVQVVQRCLEKAPERRYQSARDLAFNLELLRSPTANGHPTGSALGAGRPAGRRRRRWAAALIVLFAALAALTHAAVVVGRGGDPVSVRQVTFQRGMITGARFAPGGRVVVSASWNEEPRELLSYSPNEPEGHSLRVQNADLLGVSPSGDLAVLLDARLLAGGTLAIVSPAGGTPRELAENVVSADWSSAGDLAIVRSVGTRSYQVEFPIGTPLHRSSSPIDGLRVSPRGDDVAFIDRTDFNLKIARKGAAARTICHLSYYWGGLAWTPGGDAIWFAEGDRLWAASPSGGRRLLWTGLSPMTLQDLSVDGRALVESHDHRVEVAAIRQGEPRERLLTWLDDSQFTTVSEDGRQALFAAFPGPAPAPVAYLRAVDGGPPLKLGPGRPLDLSPDGKWVLAAPDNRTHDALFVLPVGPGTSRRIELPGWRVEQARWTRSGRSIVALALNGDDARRLLKVPLEGGSPSSLAPEKLSRSTIAISPDDTTVAARAFDGTVMLFRMDGGPVRPLPEVGDLFPVRWASDAQLWLTGPLAMGRARLVRYDLTGRRFIEERVVTSSDPVGLSDLYRVVPSRDGRVVAFNYERALGNVFVIEGLSRR